MFGSGLKGIPLPILENQVERNMEKEMETLGPVKGVARIHRVL